MYMINIYRRNTQHYHKQHMINSFQIRRCVSNVGAISTIPAPTLPEHSCELLSGPDAVVLCNVVEPRDLPMARDGHFLTLPLTGIEPHVIIGKIDLCYLMQSHACSCYLVGETTSVLPRLGVLVSRWARPIHNVCVIPICLALFKFISNDSDCAF